MAELIGRLGVWIVSYLAIASVLAGAIIPLTILAARVGFLRQPVYRHLLWSCCLLGIVILPCIRMQGWGLGLAILPPASVKPPSPEPVPKQVPLALPPVAHEAIGESTSPAVPPQARLSVAAGASASMTAAKKILKIIQLEKGRTETQAAP